MVSGFYLVFCENVGEGVDYAIQEVLAFLLKSEPELWVNGMDLVGRFYGVG